MKVGILKKELDKIKLNEKELIYLEIKSRDLAEKINKEIKKRKIKADVFVGGSLAKKTILKKDKYDIDVFVRFDRKYRDNEISDILEKLLKKENEVRIHGSRDYFQVREKNITLEIIPVLKIKKAEEARNVTDLSFFHVGYVKNKIKKNPKLADEIMLAKHFCFVNKVYGAESYIKGFSGYALELLVIHYKSFLNFIKAVSKMKKQVVLDPERYYKNKEDILLNMNEAKLGSPIIFVDSTYKERNALAALSQETFSKFKEECRKFLNKPSSAFFEKKKIDKKKFNLILKAETEKKAGDVAGSKLLKFFNFLAFELGKYFFIMEKEFVYNEEKEAEFYFKIKLKKELILSGPPITTVENVVKFRKKHKNVFIKKGRVYAREKVKLNARSFIKKFKKENKRRMKEMGITGLG